ncbi:enamine deaminase RidA (YjgF/YER057c/UK114 family) [Pseudomonas sp. SJZ079]|uniref:RidA family protein n=1 Tax=Pseudomonas sp. SJZ079 TaxID=2572887 RepID=UPI00119C43C1|nr:RidA family protein [Pseudomonas sp. SJZ079]TWC43220.1 enamine deaminase RidA (YjgF/YER057c/UK114 family) [Pseudomonas sp. SJZ079]
MSITRYETAARMSRVVVHNQTAYLCGQVAEDRSAGIEEQTRTMLAKVDTLLASVGSNREQLLSATIYLKDMSLFAAMNSVWDAWVPTGFAPARACVEASMASPELLVEISVIAAIPA